MRSHGCRILIGPVLVSAACGVLPTRAESGDAISPDEMRLVYDEVKTPHKYGIVLRPGEKESVDCPNVFRHGGRWYMVYVAIKDKVGYETLLAESDDLLDWRPLGKVLPFVEGVVGEGDSPLFATGPTEQRNADSRKMGTVPWDRWQADGSIALVDPEWGGSSALQEYDGKSWMSYFGGAKQGYETDPLSIGMAWTRSPGQPVAWHRSERNPVLSPGDTDARPFERATLYKSHVLWDTSASLGHPFVMYYNAKQQGPWVERIGMAVSDDMLHWSRFGDGPVIDNGKGISGDPQIVRLRGAPLGIDDLWVMFYFGAGWKRGAGAFDTFACSRDLVQWTKWTGPDLIAPSEPWDKTYAHKPWLLKHNGVVYHFYCAVGDEGRAIALATSQDLRAARISPKP